MIDLTIRRLQDRPDIVRASASVEYIIRILDPDSLRIPMNGCHLAKSISFVSSAASTTYPTADIVQVLHKIHTGKARTTLFRPSHFDSQLPIPQNGQLWPKKENRKPGTNASKLITAKLHKYDSWKNENLRYVISCYCRRMFRASGYSQGFLSTCMRHFLVAFSSKSIFSIRRVSG